jgi:hypothetical protein
MTVEIFLPIFFAVVMSGFAATIIVSMFNDSKEDKARAEYRAMLAKWDEQKRQEREAFDKAAWEARKARRAAMYN